MQPTREELLNEFKISPNDFEYCEFDWNQLESIYDDYVNTVSELELFAARIIGQFTKDCKDIHSIRYRIKDPAHLIAKIIRLKISNKILSNVTIDNYRTEIKDIIGFRLLHVFKEDWVKLFDYLKNNYTIYEDPFAYYRVGDNDNYIKNISSKGIKVYENEDGYRSIHVIIEAPDVKKDSNKICEIQIRTVFEEAWSEIGHSVRYPNNLNNPHLNNYFKIYNRFVGTLDEMGTYIRNSHNDEKAVKKQKDEIINEIDNLLEQTVNSDLNIKKNIQKLINNLSQERYNKTSDAIELKNRNDYFMRATQLIRENPPNYRSVIEGPSFLHPKWVVKIRNEKNKYYNYDVALLKYLEKNKHNFKNIKFIIRLSTRYKNKLNELIPTEKRDLFKTEMIDLLKKFFGDNGEQGPKILCQLTGFISTSEIYDKFVLESNKISENIPLSSGRLHSDNIFVDICKKNFDSIFQWNHNNNKQELEKLITFYKDLWKNENN